MKFTLILPCISLLLIAGRAVAQQPATSQPSNLFGIQVVDDTTGRGVPLVELKTVSSIRYYTDSAGLAAIDDPALMNHLVYFGVSSHGYQFPADGFGSRGVRLNVKPGETARIRIKRVNIAERLYRITGEGIYRDSVMLGRPTPIEKPLLNAQVTGQDSNQPVLYRGKIRYFWGDTGRQSYPLGHFGMAGATAEFPEKGGLDPSVGINLHYFTDRDGFSRPMIPNSPNRLRWADAMVVLKDAQGNEKLVGRNSVRASLAECLAMQLIVYNDAKDVFDVIREIPKDAPLQPRGHPIYVQADGVQWVYFGDTGPNVRCRADLEHFTDLSTYEAFTCLPAGARYKGVDTPLDRDGTGKLIWAWKRDTQPIDQKQSESLIRAGKMKPEEAWLRPIDVETGNPILFGASSVHFNAYRKKYIAIACQVGGSTSMLGEIWYAESDQPQGPWRKARKILTHNHYSFYNPVQDYFYDQAGGRVVYFEGTYTGTFSRNEDFTPRYDYNQIMYRLDLSDPRLESTH